MQTECTPKLFEFEAVDRRSVVAGFNGGNITSNAGALLLGQVDQGVGLVRRMGSASSAWRWAMKTSTITTSCARIQLWRFWRAS